MAMVAGNTPAHWAAQNGKPEALKYLIQHYDVNVLAKNRVGRSILTEAFQSGNTECIEICLSHDTASEDKLIDLSNKSNAHVDSNSISKDNSQEVINTKSNYDDSNNSNIYNDDMDCTSTQAVIEDEHAVIHSMLFDGNVLVKIRELPITHPDNPFGSDKQPEDDTTGLSLWPASIILAHWVAKIGLSLQNNNESSPIKNESLSKEYSFRRPRVILELGAGCGLPGIVAGIGLRPEIVYITDIHEPTLKNAEYNVKLNNIDIDHCDDRRRKVDEHDDVLMSDDDRNTTTKVIRMDWTTITSYPCEKVDLLLGSDLVYDINILAILVPTICYLLNADGSFLYVAPDTGRQGIVYLVISSSTLPASSSSSSSYNHHHHPDHYLYHHQYHPHTIILIIIIHIIMI